MHVAKLEATPVSFPYLHREVSSQVARDGVTDVIVRIEPDDGCVGWGEACSGADVGSVEAAIHAMAPFVIGSDPWNREAIQTVLYSHGLWQFRAGTANFAWAGIDMALADLAARAAGLPLYKLFGGLRRREASYFYYLARGTREELAEQCRGGLAAGYDTFYLKVGVEPAADLAMVAAVRERARPGAAPAARRQRHRGRARGAARLLARDGRARHRLRRAARARHDPVSHMAELRGAAADGGVRERGPLERGRRVRAHRLAAGRRVLLQPVLGRLARGVPAPRARRAPGGSAGLQAHARRARHRRGRLPPPAC